MQLLKLYNDHKASFFGAGKRGMVSKLYPTILEKEDNVLLKKITRFLKREDGQSFIEFALVLPILITVLSVVFDVVRIVDAKMVLNNVAGEISRTFVMQIEGVSQDENSVIERVKENFKDRLDVRRLNVTISGQTPISAKYTLRGCWVKDADETGYCKPGRLHEKEKNYRYKELVVNVQYNVDVILPLSRVVLGRETVNTSTRFVVKAGVKP